MFSGCGCGGGGGGGGGGVSTPPQPVDFNFKGPSVLTSYFSRLPLRISASGVNSMLAIMVWKKGPVKRLTKGQNKPTRSVGSAVSVYTVGYLGHTSTGRQDPTLPGVPREIGFKVSVSHFFRCRALGGILIHSR